MLILVGHATTPDKIKITHATTSELDTHVSFVDASDANPPVVQDMNKENHTFTTAGTNDICAGVADAAQRRNVKTIHIRNVHATIATDVTVIYDAIDGSDYELYKCNLAAGEALEYIEGVGFFEVQASVQTLASGVATTAQIASHSADTYYLGMPVTNSGLTRLQAGCSFTWAFGVVKGGGTAAPTFNVRFGTAGTTADTSRCLLTAAAQTAVADSGYIIIDAVFRAVGASAIIQGRMSLVHQLATTGLNVTTTGMQLVQTTGGTFDSTVANSIIGLSVNPGASGAWVVESVLLDAVGLVR